MATKQKKTKSEQGEAQSKGRKAVAGKAPATLRQSSKRKAPSGTALSAAVRVLAESSQPMRCREMIEAMAAKRYWTSPGGKTPEATLYSSILREISTKGKDSRFRKTERGKFALAKNS